MYRVCLISATFPPDVCGVGDYTCRLSEALSEAGVHVTVITSESSGRSGGLEIKGEVKRAIKGWTLPAMPALVREIRSGRYDCVHIQYTPGLYGRSTMAINLLPWWLFFRTRCKTLVTFHEIYTPILPGLRNLLLGLYDRIKDTLLLLGGTAVIVTVPNRVTRLSRLFPRLHKRLYAIPVGAGIPVERVTKAERMRRRARFGAPPEEMLIGSLGSLHTDKRYEVLFRAARRLLDRGRRFRIVLIGACEAHHPYYRQLKKCIADLGIDDYILWTGFGAPADVSRWLSMLDLYVMTDLRGAGGRKSSLITALAHGLPVVSTRGADTTGEFVHDDNIVLFEVDDEACLADHLDNLMRNPGARSRLGSGARRLYVSHYSWALIARRTLEVYTQSS